MKYITESYEQFSHLDPLLLMPRIENLADILKSVAESDKKYSLVILDLKSFHLVNARFGYEAGDLVIQEFIGFLRRKFLPKGSFSLRFRHGDEFLFFVPSEAKPDEIFTSFKEWSENHNYPIIGYRSKPLSISFHFAVLPSLDFVQYPLSESGISALLQSAEKCLNEAKPVASKRYDSPSVGDAREIRSTAWQHATTANKYLVDFFIRSRKVLIAVLSVCTVLFGVERGAKLFLADDQELLGPLADKVLAGVSELFLYYLDARFFPIILLFFFLMFQLASRIQDNRQLTLALSERSWVAEALEKTKASVPANHYLLYIHGRVGARGLEVRQRLGPAIIDAINRNIKKHEHVYWSAMDEIAMIVYEVNEKDERSFLKVIKKKLVAQIGGEDGKDFFDSLTFSSTQVRGHDLLKDVEDRTRWKLSNGVSVVRGVDIKLD